MPGLHRRCCHRNNNNVTLLFPCDVAPVAPVAPPLVFNVKQTNNKHRACVAAVTTTSSFLSSLDAKQVHDECRACTAAARQCRRRFQMRDHMSIPTIGRQSCSPPPLSLPPHRPPIPFAAVRAPLVPASKPPVVNWVNMRPLDWCLALRESGLMPIWRLLACLFPPHLHPPILLAALLTVLLPASTPPVVSFLSYSRVMECSGG